MTKLSILEPSRSAARRAPLTEIVSWAARKRRQKGQLQAKLLMSDRLLGNCGWGCGP